MASAVIFAKMAAFSLAGSGSLLADIVIGLAIGAGQRFQFRTERRSEPWCIYGAPAALSVIQGCLKHASGGTAWLNVFRKKLEMSKDFVFPFYPNDYLGGTMGFSFEQHGAYLMLLIYQFNNGPFTTEQAVGMVGEALFESIRRKFENCDGVFYNKRLKYEMDKRKTYRDKQRENAKKRWDGNANALPSHSEGNEEAMPLENEYENEYEDEDENINNFTSSGEGGEGGEFFQVFKNAYPERSSVVSPETTREFQKALTRDSAVLILAGTLEYAKAIAAILDMNPDYKYTMMAYNWLRKDGWRTDWKKEVAKARKKHPKTDEQKLHERMQRMDAIELD